MTALAVVAAVIVAFGAWTALFRRGRDDIWPRTWAVATVLIAYSVIVLGLLGRLDDVLGPAGPIEVGIGVGVGVAWLVATHIGHAVLRRLFPSFVDQVRDLYGHGVGEPPSRVLPPILAMAVAEELLFRGVVHGLAGFVTGVVVYTAVQFVERKWALALAALLGGIIWGGLFELTGGLVAPVVAHAVWTSTLTLIWPLHAGDVGDAGTEPIRSKYRSPSTNPPTKGHHA